MTRDELKRSLALCPRALCAFAITLGKQRQTLATATAADIKRALRTTQTRVDAHAVAALGVVLERVEQEGVQ